MHQLIQWLQKKGYQPPSNDIYRVIDGWDSWYKGNVASFHNYKVYNGKKEVKRQRASLQMAKKVSEDMANLLFNERVKISVSHGPTQAFVDTVFEQNYLSSKLNEMQEYKSALGTVAYVPYADDMVIDGDGLIIGGTVRVNLITGDHVIPLSWINGHVNEAAFVIPLSVSGKDYLQVQIHTLEPGGYVIENVAFDITDGKFQEVVLQDIEGCEGIVSKIETGSHKRQFVIDRLNLANNFFKGSPMGLSLFANSIDILKTIDLIYDSMENEFQLGRKRIFVKPEMLDLDDPKGVNGFDTDTTEFYMLPEDDAQDNSTLIKEVDMKLRVSEHVEALQDALNLLAEKVGFGRTYYQLDLTVGGTPKTATEVVSENSELYRTLSKHEIILDGVLRELISIIVHIGQTVLGLTNLKADAEITIDFDDSIIEDKTQEFSRDMMLFNAGVMKPEELRAKYMGESIEEAMQALAETEEEPLPEDDEE